MSFIPGEQSEIAVVASVIGSGITVTTSNDTDYIACNLVAGPGIAIVPSISNTSIEISSTGGGGGVSSVSSTANSGITATTVGTAVSLSSALVAGNGISLANGTGNNLIINNTNTLSSATGSGITLVPSGTNTAISSNLVAGSGISIVPSGLNSSKTIANAGVTQITAGSGVSINQTTGNVTISATGGGGGIQTITTPNGAGVIAVQSGTNCTINASLVAGSGISITPAINSTIQTIDNTGLLGLTSSNAGAGIAITGTPLNPIITNSNVTSYTISQEINTTGTYNLQVSDANKIWVFRTTAPGLNINLPMLPNPTIQPGSWYIITNPAVSGGVVTVSAFSAGYSLNPGQSIGLIIYQTLSGAKNYTKFC